MSLDNGERTHAMGLIDCYSDLRLGTQFCSVLLTHENYYFMFLMEHIGSRKNHINKITMEPRKLCYLPTHECITMNVYLDRDIIDKLRYYQRTLSVVPEIIWHKDSKVQLQARFVQPVFDDHSQCMTDSVTLDTSKMCSYLSLFKGEDAWAGSLKKAAQLLNNATAVLDTLKLLMQGLRKNAGRNEIGWVQIDATTMKYQRISGPQSVLFTFLCDHPLSESRLLLTIVSFL